MADSAAQLSASLNTLEREFEIIAHNMANASTTGFKRRCNSFTQAMEAQSGSSGAGDEGSSQNTFDFSQGTLVQTDRTLDLALYGKGFFVLVRPGVGDPLPEQHRKDVGLEVSGVDWAAQSVGRVPQPRLKFLLGDRHRVRASFCQ